MPEPFLFNTAQSQKDVDKLRDFFNPIFAPEPVGVFAESMSAHFPGMGPDNWFLAKEAATGEIAATFALIPAVWEAGGVRLKVAELGIVGTAAAFRGKGLQRKLYGLFDRVLSEQGYHLSVIQGIPGYYHRYGHHYAVPMEAHIRLPLSAAPGEAAKQAYTFRAAGLEDAAFLESRDAPYRRAHFISSVRGPESWRYLLTHGKNTTYGSDFFIMEPENGGQALYFRVPGYGFGGGLIVNETDAEMGWDAAMAMFAFLAGLAKERGKPFIRLNLHPDSLPARAALSLGAAPSSTYAWQVRIPDPARLLTALAPVLEKRLAGSGFAGFTGRFRLDLFTSGLDLCWENGALSAVEPAGDAEPFGTFCIPPDLLPPLLLSHRTWRELQHCRPDIFPAPQYVCPDLAPDPAGLFMDALFPAERSWVNLAF